VSGVDLDISVSTTAPRDRVWAVLTDIASWPTWTESMTSVQPLTDGPLRVGSQALVKQPGLPRLTWKVTELTEGSNFTWVARSPGVLTTAVHELVDEPAGTTRITLTVRHSGPLAGIVGALTGSRTRRYLALEGPGLKAASEAA
jgi:uncharacterized membrane protein